MALQLDTNSLSNGTLKNGQSHSPCSNDSGFHSDQVPSENITAPTRVRGTTHKPTYVSVFASDPDPNTLFDRLDRRFSTSRPDCLSSPLRLPRTDEEKRSKSPVAAPVIPPMNIPCSAPARRTSVQVFNFPISSTLMDESPMNQHSRGASYDSTPSQRSQRSSTVIESVMSLPTDGASSLKYKDPPTVPFERSSEEQSHSREPSHDSVLSQDSDWSAEKVPTVEITSPVSATNEPVDSLPPGTDNEYFTLAELPPDPSKQAYSEHPSGYNDSDLKQEGEECPVLQKEAEISVLEYKSEHEIPTSRPPVEEADGVKDTENVDLFENNDSGMITSSSSPLPSPVSVIQNRSEQISSSLEIGVYGEMEKAKMTFTAHSTPTFSMKQSQSTQLSPSGSERFLAGTNDGSDMNTKNAVIESHNRTPLRAPTNTAESTSLYSSLPADGSHYAAAYASISDVPRRHQISVSSKAASVKPTSPSRPACMSGRQSVNKLIEKFSKLDDGSPVMPQPIPSRSAPSPSSSPRSLRRTFGWRPSSVHLSSSSFDSSFSTRSLSLSASLATPEKSFTGESSPFQTPEGTVTGHSDESEMKKQNLEDEPTSLAKVVIDDTPPPHSAAPLSEPCATVQRHDMSRPTHMSLDLTGDNEKISDKPSSFHSLPTTAQTAAVKRGGLDFSRYDDITEDDIIGRPVDLDDGEPNVILSSKEIPSAVPFFPRSKPTQEQLDECRDVLGPKCFADYDIFTVNLKRSAGSLSGSVGVILSTAASNDQYIAIHKVITGSIADKSDLLEKGDRVFFVQGRSTRNMTASEAREIMRSSAEVVTFVLGRPLAPLALSTPVELFSTVSIDPDTFKYSPQVEEVELTKGSLGVGLALDGGRRSVYGDRPIVVKRIFEGGSAAKSGKVKVGDQVLAIDGISMEGMTYLEATKTLRSRPEGPVKITIKSRL